MTTTFGCTIGTKNVAKQMKKIAQGARKWEGNKWFDELSDKCMFILFCVYSYSVNCCTVFNSGKSTKTHLYWSMNNCNSVGDELRTGILNIVTHYKVSMVLSLKPKHKI